MSNDAVALWCGCPLTLEKKNITTITYLMQYTLNIQNIDYELLTKLFNYIRRLKYNQEPKYDYIVQLLSKILKWCHYFKNNVILYIISFALFLKSLVVKLTIKSNDSYISLFIIDIKCVKVYGKTCSSHNINKME